MLQGFFGILAAVLAAVGVVQVICAAVSAILEPGKKPESLLVVPIDGRVDNVEQLLRYARYTAERGPSGCRLFLLDLGMEPEALEICRRFLRESPGMLLGTEEELLRRLRKRRGAAGK
ncbi:MAG: hypothetical protein MR014_04600 [Oscillospiraceae bacterium]|nr:hypothetical protein [Oscillospiraceae bacterium]